MDRTPVPERQQDAPPRIVLVVRDDLPAPLAVNAAVVLGASTGSLLQLPLGAAGQDASGTTFPGIVTTPVPVLGADAPTLAELFRAVSQDETLTGLCLTETARRARTYEDYLAELSTTEGADSDITALVVSGPRNRVTRRTKRLPLLGAVPAN